MAWRSAAARRRYYKKWRQQNPNYNRKYMASWREGKQRTGMVHILGVKVNVPRVK